MPWIANYSVEHPTKGLSGYSERGAAGGGGLSQYQYDCKSSQPFNTLARVTRRGRIVFTHVALATGTHAVNGQRSAERAQRIIPILPHVFRCPKGPELPGNGIIAA